MITSSRRVGEDVTDPLLARTATRLADRHHQHPDDAGRWAAGCTQAWPCPMSQWAVRAGAAARGPWHEAWTFRHDILAAGITVAG
ncbi:hypothetical protein Lfu02_01090 [Longispora fulva]|uniref:Uncharacterized protein n=1 Tax=Longispora fulva TaxID=619741 RepID=A0A8J7KW22_9ACTN|nr:hypothetical protein [Longispora fulva]MBG6136022.1 hypothetical protein [Longispora fulva]GIG55737.1 hypothetical protein Lfu02_01090 [Longispora fulva]